MRKKFLLMLTVLVIALGGSGKLFAAEGNVAKVGNTEYATIGEAIAAWTNGTELTLLSDVTLLDVVTLKSTEHHILNLGTYTMTAASGKNAFVIKACGTGDAERTAITINADATNPGGINAGSNCVVYYKYADGGISGNDRPIIKINGGVFTGSTSTWGTAGIYTIGTAARKCATLNIAGGTFNCSINGSGKSKLIVSGGIFNYSVGSQGDSTALRLISGGTFKTFGFMTADSNNTKFWFGTSMGNSNVGVHVDDNGYIVVGGAVITEAGDKFEASSTNYSGANSLLQYSSAKNNGLYYTSVEEAFADNNTTSGEVTVYAKEVDMTGINFKGTIVVPAESTLTITNAPANLKVTNAEGEEITPNANGTYSTIEPKGNNFNGYVGTDRIWGEVWGNARESFVIKVLDANGNVMGTSSLNNIDGIIDGDVTVTWSILFNAPTPNPAAYWSMEWTTAPTINNMPAKVELWVDDVKVSGGNVVLNGPDDLNKIVTIVTDADGKVLSCHTTLANAVAAAQAGETVAILKAGTYALKVKNNVTITGAVAGVEFANIGAFGCNGANVTFNNVTFTYANNSTYKGLQHSGNLVYNNCTFNGQVFLYGQSETFNKCTFNQTTNNYNVWTYGAKEVAFNECKFNSAGKSVLIYAESASVTNNVSVAKCQFEASQVVEGKAAIEMDSSLTGGINLTIDAETTASGFGKGNVSNNSLWNNKKGNADAANNDITVTVDNTVVLKPIILALEGEGTAENPYLINNLEELVWFRDNVDKTSQDGSTQYAGKYIKLTADIDLAGINWNPIGSMSSDHGSFKGVFDGDNHIIKNLYVEQAGEGLGLFAYTSGNAVIKNLKLNNVTVKSTNNSSYVGGVVGNAYASTKIENVHISGDVQISGRGYIGGIAGHGYVVMDKVSVVANEGSLITSTFWCAGGILGYAGEGSTNIMNANVEGITITSAAGGLGAIVGMAEDNNGAQPISGSNLSAKNVDIKTYVGAYGTSYANYALGYLYGGNETSILTGELSVENVNVITSTGEKAKVVDAVANVDGAIYFNITEAYAAAQDGDNVAILKAGTYTVPSGKDLTITGDVDGVVFANIGAHNMGGANVTFNNVTFTYADNSTYKGLQHSGNLVYNNCTFNGQVFLYGASETFNNCTFNTTDSNNYNVWTYGAKKVAFNECTFKSAGKSVLIYAESATVFNDVTVTACTFIASTAVDGKAAIEMDSSLTGGINLTIDAATTATGFGEGNVSGNSLWNNKKGNADAANNDITVKVGNDVVLAPIYEAQIGETKYRKLADAFTAAKADDVVKVFAGTYAMPAMKADITVEGAVNADGTPAVLFNGTLSGTLENLTMKNIHIKDGNAQRWAYAKGNLLFENVTFEATSVYALHFDGITAGTNLTYKNCTIIGWAALGGSPASCTFEGCTIKGNGTYGLIRTYFNTTIKNCKFDVANVNTNDIYEDGIHAVSGAEVTVTNCTNANGDMKDLVNVHANSVVTVDDVEYKNIAKIGDKNYWTLADAIDAIGSGDVVIELLDNATLNYGAREAYGTAETTSLTINGNGKVLTLNQTNSDWSSFGLANADAKVVFNNMTIEKTGKGDTSGAWNTHAIIFSSNVEMQDVVVNNSMAVQAGAILNNVAINEANGYYGLWINGNGQSVTMNGGSITATNGGRGIKIADQYIDNPAQVKLNVTGTVFKTAKKAAVLVSSKAGAKIAASNVNIENVAADKVNFVWVDEDWAANYGNVEVTGATVAQEGKGSFVAAVEKDAKVQAYYKDLHAAMVAAKAGETVVLIADVDLAGTEWEPVSFGGTFDGKGKIISNLTINKPGVSNTGFIKSLNGTVKNVTFTNPTVTGGENTAVVAGRAGGSAALAENITINGTIKVETTHSGYARAAAIVGGWAYGNYKNITVDGGDKANSYIKHTGGGDGRYVAGIVGHADDVNSYVNCTVKNITISGGWLCGGIAGPGPADKLASDCSVENIDINADYSGGMFGWYYGAGTIENPTIKNVTFTDGSTNNGVVGGYGHNTDATVTNLTFENVQNSNGAPLLDHVASIDNKHYFTFADAIATIGNGDVTINLLRDVTLDYNARDEYGIEGTTSVTINGNNHTLTLNQKNSDWASIGLVNGKLVLNNMTIEKTGYGDTSGAWNTHAIIFSCPLEMTNVTVNNGIAVQAGATLDNVTINEAGEYYGLWINGNGQTVTMNGGAINAPNAGRGIKIADQYIDTPAQVKLNVAGTKFTTAKKAAVLVSSKAGAEIAASNVNIENVVADNVNFVWVDEDWAANYGNVEVTGATVAQESIESFVAAISKTQDGNTNIIAYYKTLPAAIAAVQAGETIELINDITATTVIELGKSITINGNGHKVTSSATRVFRVTTANTEVTLNNVNMVNTAVRVGTNDIRGISVDNVDNVKLTLNNCSVDFTDASACDWAYAVNVVGGNAHVVTVNGGTYEGANVINVLGTTNTVVVKDATLTSLYPNNDVYYGACIYVKQDQNSSVEATGNTFNGSNAIAFNVGYTPVTESKNTDNTQKIVAMIGAEYYTSLVEAFAEVEDNETIKVLHNVELTEAVVNTKTITLNLNGKTVVATDNATGSYAMITNKGNLTIEGEGKGKLQLTATNNRGWNAYSSVISNTVGGKLTVNGGTIEHLGGTDMAYGIDNLTNGKGTYAETVVNGGTVKSTYRAIRQFLNGTEAQNILTVNGGTIEGANKSIWMQDPSKNANSGKLTVGENAALKGNAYLTVTAGSTEWPVEVSIASAALRDGSVVATSNVPAEYIVKEVNGVWGVYVAVASANGVNYATLQEAINAGCEVVVLSDIALTETVTVAKGQVVTLNLNGKTISAAITEQLTKSFAAIQNRGTLTVKDSATTRAAGRITVSYAGTTFGYGFGLYTISNEGGVLKIESGIVENTTTVSGSMYDAIDNNSTTGNTVLNILGGEVKCEKYIGIRQFANSTTHENIVNVTGGKVVGGNTSIWMQNPGSNQPKATIAISGDANITGRLLADESTGFVFNVIGGTFTTNVEGFCAENFSAIQKGTNLWVVKQTSGELTRTLPQGWSWFSSYVKIAGAQGLTTLESALGTSGVQIKDEAGRKFAQYSTTSGWYGSLTSASSEKMYSINTSAAVDVNLDGDFFGVENYKPILAAGWNYMAYPHNDTLDLATALRGFAPVEGDIIKSKSASAIYLDGSWYNAFDLVPGEGYMYRSQAGTKQVSYTTEATRAAVKSFVSETPEYWTVDATQYPGNMTMIATLDVEGGDYEVAAFVNGELRGSARPIFNNVLDQYIVIMTINGDEAANVTFKYYDFNAGEEYDFNNVAVYSDNAVLGSTEEPYALTRGTTGIGEATLSDINIYPNPTTTDREINLQATCDKVEVFNALGVKVAEYQNVDTIDALETAGTYVIRVTLNGDVKHCRLVVK